MCSPNINSWLLTSLVGVKGEEVVEKLQPICNTDVVEECRNQRHLWPSLYFN